MSQENNIEMELGPNDLPAVFTPKIIQYKIETGKALVFGLLSVAGNVTEITIEMDNVRVSLL